MNLRDQILNANDRKTAKVETPEWGGHVYVRTLSAAELRGYQANLKAVEDQATKDGLMAVTIMCDEQGNRIFSDDDAALLAGKNSKVLDRIAGAFAKLNAITDEQVDAIQKNSSTPPNSN